MWVHNSHQNPKLYTQRNNLQDDVTSCSWLNPLVPSSCSTQIHGSQSMALNLALLSVILFGHQGFLTHPRGLWAPSPATCPSLFSLLDLSPCPSRRTWEGMTVLCLVPEPCPRVVDAQRNTTNYEWASEWLPRWPGCLPSILPLETMELSTISTVLSFPRHVIGIILYVAFSEGLLSLSNMHLKLLHVFSWLNSSLIFSADLYSIVWVYHSLFIHSLLKDILVVFKFQQLWIKLL